MARDLSEQPSTNSSLPVGGGFLERHRFVISTALHGGLFVFALFAAFLLAYNFRFEHIRGDTVHQWFGELYLKLLALALPIKLGVFLWSGQYHSSWRYVGLRDLFGVVSSSLVASFLLLTVYFILENVYAPWVGTYLIDPPDRYLRQSSVFLLDCALTVVFISAAKVMVRFYFEEVRPQRSVDRKRVLIIGAGNEGESLLRELLRMRAGSYECVGFVDDRAAPQQGRIHGVEILGGSSGLRNLCELHEIDEVLIASPHATPKIIRELVQQCEGTGVLFRTVPPMADVIAGKVTVSQVREVEIADLLGRAEVELDVDKIGEQLRGKRALVTGAGGSIGSEMCRQIARYQPECIILVEQAENNLFEIDRELRKTFPGICVKPRVADIIDEKRLEVIFSNEKPTVVFHAAAHKHVPMMEINPSEAIKNNIGGSHAVADACIACGVSRMVMISTDKAVNPTSVMGCSKRVAEMYVQGLSVQQDQTQFVTVRFGNVLGSSGSVVPIFKEQIARGGPVTVTHPEMTRFFMTIPEAAQLVLQAGTMGKGGEVYVLHMGEPVKIVDMARDMISLSGLRPGYDIDITFSGMRPGEKLYEELMSEGEAVSDTAHPKIGIWNHRLEDWEQVQRGIDDLRARADTMDSLEIKACLQRLVPEYTPDDFSALEAEQTRAKPLPEAELKSDQSADSLSDLGKQSA